MTSKAPKPNWIMMCDERHARLYSCQRVAGPRWHVDERKTLENRWENYHERHRPYALGRGPTSNAAQHFASSGHEPEEEHRRFAREVGEWMRRLAKELGIEHLRVFAAARFLGMLRDELGDVGAQVDLHEGELTRLSSHELSTHPAIVKALAPQAG
jgi:protein required for attachment to host cells